MKTKKYLEDLRDKTIQDLESELTGKKKELFNLRFQLATNQCENPVKVREVRHQIAQINTIMKQKETAK